MHSDSESQDSDDGRRFRFEATRKDSAISSVDTDSRTKSSKKNSKHKSESRKYDRDKKERSKYESYRRTEDKDFRHFVKHSNHDLKRSKPEDRISRKDHRDARATSAGSAVYDRDSKNSSGSEIKDITRDPKRQSDRDRTIHNVQRFREHSHERNYNQRDSSDKHRNRYRERRKYHSRDKSRDKSYQSNKVKSSDIDRSREDYGKYDTLRKLSVKENKSQNFEDYSASRKIKQARGDSEPRSISSNESTRKNTSMDAQDCKDFDLSQFDVLSETDENISDSLDSKDQDEKQRTKQMRKHQEKQYKVRTRNNDSPFGSNNSNPSAVSDSSLSPIPSTVSRKSHTDSRRETSEYHQKHETSISNSNEYLDLKRKHFSVDEIQLLKEDTKQSTHCTLLTTESPLVKSNREKVESSLSDVHDITSYHKEVNKRIVGDISTTKFIGPCLPQTDEIKDVDSIKSQLNNYQNGKQECTEDNTTPTPKADLAFGPALPPHLLKRKHDSDSQDRIIGPALPSTATLYKENSEISSESDDDGAIGPLPVDHPALRNSHVHMLLDVRAQQIKDEGPAEESSITNKNIKIREEWMTELPPAHAVNLGLGPRKFRVREGPDMSDRSCWTDTPTQKAQKQKDLETKTFSNIQESDKECTKESHQKEKDKNRKRQSLLEIHQSKLKKKRKKEEKEAKLSGASTRRPFDRDIDLQANRFNQVQKKNVLTKAQLLDDRFSRGQM